MISLKDEIPYSLSVESESSAAIEFQEARPHCETILSRGN